MNLLAVNRYDGFSRLNFNEIPADLFLSSRKDLKYLVPLNIIPQLIGQLKNDYLLMVNGDASSALYLTNYYDTQSFMFYNSHHRGLLHRHKIRTRTYMDGKCFLEIKSKDNKGVTHKLRTAVDQVGFNIEDHLQYVEDHIKQKIDGLAEKLKVQYQRTSFYHKTLNEKITFDFSYHAESPGGIHQLNNVVMVESKGIGHNDSFFNCFMRSLKIRPVSFSKYCYGMIYLEPSLKFNNFRSILRKVNKLKNDNDNIAANN